MLEWLRTLGHSKRLPPLTHLAGALLALVILLASLPGAASRPTAANTAGGAHPSATAAHPQRDDIPWHQGMWGTGSPFAVTGTPSPTNHSQPTTTHAPNPTSTPAPTVSAQQAFASAAQEFDVPVPLLEAICYMEGRLSNQGGQPSIDNGFGCMHLVVNPHADTLDQAAQALGVSTDLLKADIATNIRGGAAVLHADALQLSGGQLPATLADWYGAAELYSTAQAPSTARLYADTLYRLLNTGFSALAETGETITLAPQGVHPNTDVSNSALPHATYPAGCQATDASVDYPGAIDCILPTSFDCIPKPDGVPCTYEDANRPTDLPIAFVVIHDIEGTAADALATFQDINSLVSCHYIVDQDGTVYQVVREKDIAYQAGNYWYNQHSIGIEHTGFDATGYQWYNATEYLASAKLTAFLVQKYNIPLDHNHVVAHGTVPGPSLDRMPNHVDPGPYWLWAYYFDLIHQQGVPYSTGEQMAHMLMLYPRTSAVLAGLNGTETAGNFNFFYLYNGPSTASGRIPQSSTPSDITDVTNDVEPTLTYYYLNKVTDPAGTGNTMYQIWYGETDRAHAASPSQFIDAKLVWLAVPPGAARDGSGPLFAPPWVPQGALVRLSGTAPGTTPAIYGRPSDASIPDYIVGSAPNGALFTSAFTVVEDGTANLWYEINLNHRQAWVPASEVTVLEYPPGGLGSLPATLHPGA